MIQHKILYKSHELLVIMKDRQREIKKKEIKATTRTVVKMNVRV